MECGNGGCYMYAWSWGITRRTVSTPRVAQGPRYRDSGNETLGVVAGELKPVPELGLTCFACADTRSEAVLLRHLYQFESTCMYRPTKPLTCGCVYLAYILRAIPGPLNVFASRESGTKVGWGRTKGSHAEAHYL